MRMLQDALPLAMASLLQLALFAEPPIDHLARQRLVAYGLQIVDLDGAREAFRDAHASFNPPAEFFSDVERYANGGTTDTP